MVRSVQRPAGRGKHLQRNRALELIRSLNTKPKTRSGCEYGAADTERALQVKVQFPDIFRTVASQRLHKAVEEHIWFEEKMLIEARRGYSVPSWVEDLWALTNPKTPIDDLRTAGARLREMLKDLSIPDLATVFGPRKKRGAKIKEDTLRRINLAGDLTFEGLNKARTSIYLFPDLPPKVAYDKARSELWLRYRSEIGARVSLRKRLS